MQVLLITYSRHDFYNIDIYCLAFQMILTRLEKVILNLDIIMIVLYTCTHCICMHVVKFSEQLV